MTRVRIIALFAGLLLLGCNEPRQEKPKEPKFRNDAARRFHGYVTAGLKVDRDEIAKAFLGTFEVGLPAAEVQDILETAGRKTAKGEEIEFEWYSEIDDGRIFYVVVWRQPASASDDGKSPPLVIKSRLWQTLPS